MAPICLQAPRKHVCVYEEQRELCVWVSITFASSLTMTPVLEQCKSLNSWQPSLFFLFPFHLRISSLLFLDPELGGKSCLALPVNPAHEIHFLAFPSLKDESILKSAYVLRFSPLIHLPTVSETIPSV